MPVVDKNTGEPVSDAPDQDEAVAGGKGRGDFVDTFEGPEEGSGVVTGPDNEREAQPGAVKGSDGPGSTDAGSGS